MSRFKVGLEVRSDNPFPLQADYKDVDDFLRIMGSPEIIPYPTQLRRPNLFVLRTATGHLRICPITAGHRGQLRRREDGLERQLRQHDPARMRGGRQGHHGHAGLPRSVLRDALCLPGSVRPLWRTADGRFAEGWRVAQVTAQGGCSHVVLSGRAAGLLDRLGRGSRG